MPKKLPSAAQLGGVPDARSGRAIARIDTSLVGTGAEAMGAGLRNLGSAISSLSGSIRKGGSGGGGEGRDILTARENAIYEADKALYQFHRDDLIATQQYADSIDPDNLEGAAAGSALMRRQRLNALADSDPVQKLRKDFPDAATAFELKLLQYDNDRFKEDYTAEQQALYDVTVPRVKEWVDEVFNSQYQYWTEKTDITEDVRTEKIDELNRQLWDHFKTIPTSHINPVEREKVYREVIGTLHKNAASHLPPEVLRMLNDVSGDEYRVEPDSFPSFWTDSSLRYSRDLDPTLQHIFSLSEAFLPDGWSFQLISGKRTEEQQEALYRSGRSPTNTSQHELARAGDIRPYYNGKEMKTDEGYRIVATALKIAAQELGATTFRWGGDFRTPDRPHFDMGLQDAQFKRGPHTNAQTNELRTAIIREAKRIGMDPVVMATIFSYETAGTFDPWKQGPVTQWGRHMGFIQMGEPQRREHGYLEGMSISDLVRASADYFVKNGYQAGMGLLDAYSIVNTGGVGRYHWSDAGNGGAPGTVAQKVKYQMDGHRRKGAQLISGGGEIVLGSKGGSYSPLRRSLWGLTSEDADTLVAGAMSADSPQNKAYTAEVNAWSADFKFRVNERGADLPSLRQELEAKREEFAANPTKEAWTAWDQANTQLEGLENKNKELKQAYTRIENTDYLNPRDPEQRKDANLVFDDNIYAENLFSKDQREKANAIQATAISMDSFSMVPDSIFYAVQNRLDRPQDWDTFKEAMEVIESLIEANPDIAMGKMGFGRNDDILKMYDRYQLRSPLVDDEYLRREFSNDWTSEERNTREEMHTKGAEIAKNIDIKWKGVSREEINLVSTELRRDFEEIFPLAYFYAQGDEAQALELAYKWLGRTKWGRTQIGSENRLMKWAPEQHHPSDWGNWDYLDRQLEVMVKLHNPEATRWGIVASPAAQEQIENGELPTYWVWYATDADTTGTFIKDENGAFNNHYRFSVANINQVGPDGIPPVPQERPEPSTKEVVLSPSRTMLPEQKLQWLAKLEQPGKSPEELIEEAHREWIAGNMDEAFHNTFVAAAEATIAGADRRPRYWAIEQRRLEVEVTPDRSASAQRWDTWAWVMKDWYDWRRINPNADSEAVRAKVNSLIVDGKYDYANALYNELAPPDGIADKASINDQTLNSAMEILQQRLETGKPTPISQREFNQQQRLIQQWFNVIYIFRETQAIPQGGR